MSNSSCCDIKPKTRILAIKTSSSVTNRDIFELRSLVESWQDASITLCETVNETFPELIGVN